jgi:4'-phosphopantetheinyl transferase
MANAPNLATTWSAPPADYALLEDEVHVWRAVLHWPSALDEPMARLLSPDERDKMAGFHFERDRLRYLVGRAAVRTLLGRLSGAPASDLRFEYNAFGKPSLAAGTEPQFQFNISHSAEIVVIALARGRAIGIDVECIRSNAAIMSIAARYFSANEYKTLTSLDSAMQRGAFFACWTRKEAYLKARGDGLQLPLNRFEVVFAPGEEPRLTANLDDSSELTRWSLRELDVGQDYKAALAVEGADWQLKCWDWYPAFSSQAKRAPPAP